MKRVGYLFERAFSRDALYQAWLDASHGKMSKHCCLAFSKRLSSNLDALHDELHSGRYVPTPYTEFCVYEPKKRTIYAPAFRDLVVQHAIYRLIYPIFDRTLIDQSYACRHGKGTHKAADYAQAALRRSPPGSHVLKLDIRKFFYRIERDVLQQQIERKIKDRRFVAVMMQFAEYGHPKKEPVGIPIGNLLSQLYALIYLNPLDQFVKHELHARLYCRYVDDFIIFGWGRQACLAALDRIKVFLREQLHLELSRYSLLPASRGVNFVGYRTWTSRRYIRKHSLYTFSRSAGRGELESVISVLGHAKETASLKHLLTTLQERFHALFVRLPQAYRCRLHPRAAPA